MAFFNVFKIKSGKVPIPDTPSYIPPNPPTPVTPQDGSTPITPLPTYDPNITIVLYNCYDDNNVVEKTLTNQVTFNGVFKNSVDDMKPYVDIETSTNITTHNYCYIATFNRYYYITSIEVKHRNVVRLYLKCDVLMSHKVGIKKIVAVIDRVENKGKSYKNLFNDNQVNDMGYRTEIKKFPTQIFSDTPKLVLVVNGGVNTEGE